jgi:hypothetical protein
MLGIIELFLLRFICILLSPSPTPRPLSVVSKMERDVDLRVVFCLRWLFRWICKCSFIPLEVLVMLMGDRFTKTNMSYGVNEVLLASVLGSVVFAVFAAQPLVIVGVTGPITVFN